jgi:hypothetical protein
MDHLKQLLEQFKHWIDLAAVSTGIATLLSWFPHIAGAFTILWCYYRVKEIRLAIRLKELEIHKLSKET